MEIRSLHNAHNLFAVLMLGVWPLVCLAVMRMSKRPEAAIAGLFLASVMLLPCDLIFKLPGLPDSDKLVISSFWIFVGAWIFHRERFVQGRFRQTMWFPALFGLFCAVGTSLMNSDRLVFGPHAITGLNLYDSVHIYLPWLVMELFPFYLGYTFYRSADDLETLFRALILAIVLYSPLIWYEKRFAPVLHMEVYGYAQHQFLQTIRPDGSYRPMVFMAHGLALSILAAMAVLAAWTLTRAGSFVGRFPWAQLDAGRRRFARAITWTTSWYLSVLLYALKSFGSLVYGVLGSALIFFAGPRTQVRVALVVACIAMAYPLLRASDLVPVKDIVHFVATEVNPERAQSLDFRFENEEELLAKARKRIWFGWGYKMRAYVFDPWSGDPMSIRDGRWIILLGDDGVMRFLLSFGMMVAPVVLAFIRLPWVHGKRERRLYAALALMTAIEVFDMVPNGGYNYLPYFLAGSLLGVQQGMLGRAKYRSVVPLPEMLAYFAKRRDAQGEELPEERAARRPVGARRAR